MLEKGRTDFPPAQIWGTPTNFEVLDRIRINLSKKRVSEKKSRWFLTFLFNGVTRGGGLRRGRLEGRVNGW